MFPSREERTVGNEEGKERPLTEDYVCYSKIKIKGGETTNHTGISEDVCHQTEEKPSSCSRLLNTPNRKEPAG